MARLPIVILAGAAGALAAAAGVLTMTKPGTEKTETPAAATDAAGSAAKDTITSARGSGDPSYWTEERMRAAKPLPLPKVTREEFDKLMGTKKDP